ncbi:restriction endonuclease subunit S [Desulfobacter sp.]
MAVWSVASVVDVSGNKRMDSEFFDPKYINYENHVKKSQNSPLGLIVNFVIGPFGSAFHVSNYDPNSSFRYIRGKDVKPFQLLQNDNVYMPKNDYQRLKKYSVYPNDLIISVVGTLGNVAIISKKENGIFSCKSTLLRNSKIDAHYLLAYLNSQYGKRCLLRRQRGAVQTGLNKDDLRTVPIPIVSNDNQKKIGKTVEKALELADHGKSLYSEVQKNIEQELGLDKLKFRKPVGYEANFSQAMSSSRADAEHFYPEFDNICCHLPAHIKFTPLSKALVYCQRGKQPKYSENGIRVINSKHVLSNKINFENNRLATSPPIDAFTINHGDVLMNGTGRGTIGRAAPYLEIEPALSDNHVTILRTRGIDPVYLSVFLNSKAGQLQVEKHQRGSSGQIELYPQDIRKFLIWEAPRSLQSEIRDLHDQASALEKESKQLLEQAKQMVEDLIEQAAGNHER